MAKILQYYSLCPLIEDKNFLGISKDVDSDTVLVTSNSNIIARYKVSDPKQISSWNCKGNLTSAAVYGSCGEQYVAIFNRKEIRKWTIADENIDNVKKFKFAEKLRGLLTSPENGQVFVVFDKGYVLSLDDAIADRKKPFSLSRLNDESHQIIFYDIACCSDVSVVVLLIREASSIHRILGILINEPNNLSFDLQVTRLSKNLLGYCLYVDKHCYFISLWSDGKLYRDCIFPNEVSVPFHCIATIDNVDLEKPVVMKMLSSHYLAICGTRKDGLMLIIYDVKFNLVQCQQFYEHCPSIPQLWNFGSKLCLIMGHNLVVVPYVEEHRNLSTLIGCNLQLFDDKIDVLPESAVYLNLIPELLEQNDSKRIYKIVESRCDIPDSALINILSWSIKKLKTRQSILDVILNEYCTNINDVSVLRTHCTMEYSLEILDYIMTSISQKQSTLNLLKWALLFVDAFYQEYVMSENAIILEKLKSYTVVLKKECAVLNEFKKLSSAASCISRKKIIFCK